NLAEILAQLQSSEWSCPRRDGLASFSSYLAREGGPSLNQLELRRVCDIFAKMFGEPNGRALADFVTRYHGELHDWLYTLLVRLSVAAGAGRRCSSACCRWSASCQPTLWCPGATSPTSRGRKARIALSRLTTLTKDPKSPDVRRLSQASAVLKEMQPTIQQRATDVLRLAAGGPRPPVLGRIFPHLSETPQKAAAGVWAAKFCCCSDARAAVVCSRGGVTKTSRRCGPTGRSRNLRRRRRPRRRRRCKTPPRMAGDGSDDLLNSIHMAALNLQSFTRTAEDADATENKAPLIEALPAPTPVRPAQLANGRAPASALQPSRKQQQQQPPLTAVDRATVAEVTSTPSRFQPVQKQQQQQAPPALPPAALQSTLGQPDFEDFDDDEELLDDDDEDIDEMSTDDAARAGRMSSNAALVRMVRDNSADIRALALTVLQELIRAQPRRLSNYTELTLLKILEAHRDTDKLVAKAAEDCAKHVAAHLPGDVCLRVLTPLVSGADPGLALAAVKMQMRVVQECEPRAVEAALPELCPGLVRCCDHAESQIRKAAIFCLVQMYMKVGETLLLHLKDMSSTKRRLLQLYICKARVGTAQDAGGGGGAGGLPCLQSAESRPPRCYAGFYFDSFLSTICICAFVLLACFF
uniref:TOG domain-containing protein n=1 Tax=Macrostomum lignano TaxID=282301 RepID=A0A1I8FMF7_9PLAT